MDDSVGTLTYSTTRRCGLDSIYSPNQFNVQVVYTV